MPSVLPRKQPYLAVSWDKREVVYVLAQPAGGKLVVEAAGSIDRPTESDEPALVADLLQDALQSHQHHVKRAKLLVGLARSQVEVLDLTLPPATDEELAELVRNQTLQQSVDVTDDSVIDFVMLDDDPAAPRKVTAAIAPAELLKSVREQCSVSGHPPSCITLRPHSAASLCRRIVGPSMGKCLLVSRLDTEADFSIIAGGKVVFSRTIRLTSEPTESAVAEQFAAEINRSLLVAPQSSDEDEPVEHIYLFGAFPEKEQTLEQLAEQLELPVSLVNPLKGVALRSELITGDVNHFAGLLGMIRDHVAGEHAIDFVHPKQPPPPPNYRRKAAFYATAAAVVIAVGFQHFAAQRRDAAEQVQALSKKVNDIELLLKATNKKKAVVDAVARWQAEDVNWLDELRDLSLRFPPSPDAVIQRLSASVSGTGGVVELQVQVRNPTVLTEMENQFRDPYHQVRVKGAVQQSEEAAYRWKSSVTVYVHQRGKDQYVTRLPGTKPKTPTPVQTGESAPQISQAKLRNERK